MYGGIRLMVYDSVVTLNSGASGHGCDVSDAPPVLWRASRTTTFLPYLARYAAATSPLWPRPINGALRRVKRCHRRSRKEPAVTNLHDVLTGNVLDPHWRPIFV